ncbi:M50 family metallopeptidase [Aquibacillus kalidii]|uniref:M50 family metallopeptidase n=1 Tax=Aquibacillus kalidii TaxID=2762597 RepID=UPI0016482AC9|nr:M50 family metallopeptidase [Aquibacillus kalidii]
MNLIYYMIGAIILIKTPFIGTYIRLINTITHEIWHVVIASVTGGKGHRIALNRDTSGYAITSNASWISRVLTAYAGYTGASITALLLFYLLNEGRYSAVLTLYLVIAAIASVLWIRNVFGFLWTSSFVILIWLLLNHSMDILIIHISYMLAAIILVESILSASHILRISFFEPKNAGDATNLQKATLIPAVIWGTVFFVQSVYIGYQILLWFNT